MWNWGKDRYWLAVVALVLVMVLVFAGACGGSDEEATATSGAPASSVSSAEGGADGTLLEVIGPEGTVSLTLEQIRALQVTEGYGGMKSSTGRITPPGLMKGVLLEDLFASVGGLPEDMAVSIVAKDGYEMTVSAAQVTAGDFLTYDMVTGAENDPERPLQVIIAYERDGQPLDPEGEGTLRLAIIGPKKDQVTDGHWWVKWVTKLQVKPIEEEWTLTLSGAISEEIDRSTFDSCANTGCHGQAWTDSEGNIWTGVPLYLPVGRVDDENVHEGPAYNRDLAEAGYDVVITSSDGSSVTVNSKTMYYKNDLILANRLNGETLPEEFWPLRLVGEGIPATDMTGGVTEIKALIPAQ
jgi:DMSO/TMAO reductase YedYZ molybdopterin-dependent catalytic subunit